MLFYYDNNGKLVTISPHGEIPRQGGALVLYVLMNKNFNDNANDPGEDGTGMQNRMMTTRFKCPSEITFSEDYPMTLNSELWKFEKLPGESIGSLIDGEEYYLFTVDLSNTYANKEAGNLEIVFTLYKYEMEDDEPVIDTSMTINLGKATVFIEETLGLAPYSGVGMTYTEYQSLMAHLNMLQDSVSDVVHKTGAETITGSKTFTVPQYFRNKIDVEEIEHGGTSGTSSITLDETALLFNYLGGNENVGSASLSLASNGVSLSRGIENIHIGADGIKFYSGTTPFDSGNLVATLYNDTANSKKSFTGNNAYLEGWLVTTPVNDNDIVNKHYTDGIKTALETTLSGKADLDNNKQDIRAKSIAVSNVVNNESIDTGIGIEPGIIYLYAYSSEDDDWNQIAFSYDRGLTGLQDPTRDNGAANKHYVDTGDNNLQSQIDALNAAQNLADIVADLTALNNLPTTNLQPNDKVQVIVDSNHNNASTIYRWTGSTWEYIGVYGSDSYTKSEINTMMNQKQNVISSQNKILSDYVDDSGQTNKFVTQEILDKINDMPQISSIYTSEDMTNSTIESYMSTYNDVHASYSRKVLSLTNASVDENVLKLNAKNVEVVDGVLTITTN